MIKTAAILDFTVRLKLFRRVLKLKAFILDQKYGRVKNYIELLLDDFVYLCPVFLQNETQTTIAEKSLKLFSPSGVKRREMAVLEGLILNDR